VNLFTKQPRKKMQTVATEAVRLESPVVLPPGSETENPDPTKDLHRVIFTEGHLGATAAGRISCVSVRKGSAMLHIIETTHGWAVVTASYLIVSLHGSFNEAAAARRRLLS
jgi:hypothetical protein